MDSSATMLMLALLLIQATIFDFVDSSNVEAMYLFLGMT